MGMKSQTNGNKGEDIVCKWLREKRYWAHLTKRSATGAQPVDIIAIRFDCHLLCDAKYVSEGKKGRFSFDDIQPDQITSMRYARDYSGIEELGFCIVFEGCENEPRFMPLKVYEALIGANEKSVKMEELPTMAEMEEKRWKY